MGNDVGTVGGDVLERSSRFPLNALPFPMNVGAAAGSAIFNSMGELNEADLAMFAGGVVPPGLALAFLIAKGLKKDEGNAPEEASPILPDYSNLFNANNEDKDDKTIAERLKGILVSIFDGILGNGNGKIDTEAEKQLLNTFLESLKEDEKDEPIFGPCDKKDAADQKSDGDTKVNVTVTVTVGDNVKKTKINNDSAKTKVPAEQDEVAVAEKDKEPEDSQVAKVEQDKKLEEVA